MTIVKDGTASVAFPHAPIELQDLSTFAKATEFARCIAAKLSQERLVLSSARENALPDADVKDALAIFFESLFPDRCVFLPFTSVDVDRAVSSLEVVAQEYQAKRDAADVKNDPVSGPGKQKKSKKSDWVRVDDKGAYKHNGDNSMENSDQSDDEAEEKASKANSKNKAKKQQKQQKRTDDDEIEELTMEDLDRRAEEEAERRRVEDALAQVRLQEEQKKAEEERAFLEEIERKRQKQQEAINAARAANAPALGAVMSSGNTGRGGGKKGGNAKRGGGGGGGALW